MSVAGPAKPKVAVVYTSPETVIDDIGRAMRLADYQSHLPGDLATLLKINISWQHYYPACSTSPWQLDGVIHALKDDGYSDLIPAHNGTVVVDPVEGALKNKHEAVEQKHGLESVFLDFPPAKWVDFKPKSRMIALDDIYPEGFQVPEMFFGKNIIHLPTMKTHVFTTITGAMKNAFGGLLNRKAPLDALGHPRDARRSPQHPEGDTPRHLRRHRRDVCRRRPRSARHEVAREERHSRRSRSGRR